MTFVGLAFHAKFLVQLFCVVFAPLGTAGVGDGDLGTHFGAATSGFNADAGGAGGTGHDDDFAFEAEEVLEGVGFGDFDRHACGCWGFLGFCVGDMRSQRVMIGVEAEMKTN